MGSGVGIRARGLAGWLVASIRVPREAYRVGLENGQSGPDPMP